MKVTEFYWVFDCPHVAFEEHYRVLPSFTELYRFDLGRNTIWWCLLFSVNVWSLFYESYRVFTGFLTALTWPSWNTTEFYRVLPSFNGLILVETRFGFVYLPIFLDWSLFYEGYRVFTGFWATLTWSSRNNIQFSSFSAILIRCHWLWWPVPGWYRVLLGFTGTLPGFLVCFYRVFLVSIHCRRRLDLAAALSRWKLGKKNSVNTRAGTWFVGQAIQPMASSQWKSSAAHSPSDQSETRDLFLPRGTRAIEKNVKNQL